MLLLLSLLSGCAFSSFFLFFHQLADDEALIIFLQTSLFLVFPYAVDNCMPLSSKSSLTLSIHLFLCLSLLLYRMCVEMCDFLLAESTLFCRAIFLFLMSTFK